MVLLRAPEDSIVRLTLQCPSPIPAANLVANLVTPKAPYQLISSIQDFISTGSTACVINRASHRQFLQQGFPDLPASSILMVPSTSINVLLSYVKAGRCQGAVSTNVHLEYGMGLGDIKARDRACGNPPRHCGLRCTVRFRSPCS